MKMNLKIFCVFWIILLMTATAFGEQPEYPTRPIEYVVPYGAGGGTDAIARVVAHFATKKLGQPIMVVNKPGGGGVIGASYVLKQSKPDGYTIQADVHSASSILVGGMINPPITLEDRTFVARIIVNPLAYAVKADAPWKTFKEFSDWVKANPEKLTWASVGPSGFSAYGVQDWLAAIGADAKKTRMVPSKGASDSLVKVAGGHVVLAVPTVAECYSLHKAGKIRVLAIQSGNRSKYLPDVPTALEQGVKGLSVKWWTGLVFRKGTPDYAVKKWEKAIEEMINDPEFQQKIDTLHAHINYLNSKDFKKFVYDEAEYYTGLAKRIGIRK